MARVTVEDCLKFEKSRFALVRLTVKRAKQLLDGFPVAIPPTGNKQIVSALREIAAGKVKFIPAPHDEHARENQRVAPYRINFNPANRLRPITPSLSKSTKKTDTKKSDAKKSSTKKH